jgi:eukaryotic-like serine/threonine-protein kinase
MSVKQFLRSKIFLKHLLLSFAVTLGLIFFILLVLKIYTRHGQGFPVPDVSGMTEEKFSEVLDDAHLKYKVIDSTYNPAIAPGGVVGQIPNVGHKVKRNRTIYLTINTKAPEQVEVPKLTDISYRQAVAQLESVGLLPGKIIYESSEFQNLVLRARYDGRDIAEGEKVVKGSIIDLVLGTGESEGAGILPDLRGMTVSEAMTILSNSSLNLGNVYYDETILTSTDTLTARIYRQHPNPDFSFQTTVGSNIDVWLSTDRSKFRRESDQKKDDSDFF